MRKVFIFTLIFALFCGTTYAEPLDTCIEEQLIELSAPIEAENCWFYDDDFSFLEFEDSKIVLGVGEVYKPTVYTDAPEWMLDFYSKKSKVAEVDVDGTIYAKKKGSTKIVVTAGPAEAILKVEVKKAPSSIKLPSVVNMPLNDLEDIEVKLSSGSASHIEWYSSNERIVEVADGLVYGKKAGTAYVVAETYNGKRASCIVNVYKPAHYVYISPYISLKKGKSMTIVPEFRKGEWDTYKIYSDNTHIVKVSGNKIKARKRGFATITVQTNNGVEAETEVYVY